MRTFPNDQALAPDESRRRAWVSSIGVGLIFVAVALGYSFLYFPVFQHQSAWMVPRDTWLEVDGGRFVWSGALPFVYQGSGAYALPFGFVLVAPMAGIIDHFQLLEGAPYPVPHPTAWLAVGPYELLLGIFCLHAARRLAWTLGVRRHLWLVQCLMVLLVLAPCYLWGHFEDAVALTMVIYAARRVLMGDWIRAALLISIAVASKQWAALLIPFVFLAAPTGLRLRCLLAASALPAALALLTLGADWPDASKNLLSPVNLGSGAQGHLSFYATWLGSRTSQVSRSIGLGAGCLVAWWVRKAARPVSVLAAMAVVVGLRPLFEAVNYSYYWSPGLVLAGFVGLAAHRSVLAKDWLCPVVAMLWAFPHGNSATANLWWSGEAFLMVLIMFQVARNCSLLGIGNRKAHSGSTSQESSAKADRTPMVAIRVAGDTAWTR